MQTSLKYTFFIRDTSSGGLQAKRCFWSIFNIIVVVLFLLCFFFLRFSSSIFASGTTTALCDFHYSRHIRYLTTVFLCQSQLTAPVPREDHCVRVKFSASIRLSHRTAVAAGGRTAAAEVAKVSCLAFDTDIASHRIARSEPQKKSEFAVSSGHRRACTGMVSSWKARAGRTVRVTRKGTSRNRS